MRVNRRYVRFAPFFVGVSAALLLAGCGSPSEPDTAAADGQVEVSGTFAEGTGPAFTYDPQRVPVGATATVSVVPEEGSTRTTLRVSGLNPNSTYGSHAHDNPCGADGDAAGPHYQLEKDPVTPSVDPAFANPTNEIWLDFTTDAQGAATSTSTVPWTFPADRRAQSVIIHDMATMTEPGMAGMAGGRPACIDVDF